MRERTDDLTVVVKGFGWAFGSGGKGVKNDEWMQNKIESALLKCFPILTRSNSSCPPSPLLHIYFKSTRIIPCDTAKSTELTETTKMTGTAR